MNNAQYSTDSSKLQGIPEDSVADSNDLPRSSGFLESLEEEEIMEAMKTERHRFGLLERIYSQNECLNHLQSVLVSLRVTLLKFPPGRRYGTLTSCIEALKRRMTNVDASCDLWLDLDPVELEGQFTELLRMMIRSATEDFDPVEKILFFHPNSDDIEAMSASLDSRIGIFRDRSNLLATKLLDQLISSRERKQFIRNPVFLRASEYMSLFTQSQESKPPLCFGDPYSSLSVFVRILRCCTHLQEELRTTTEKLLVGLIFSTPSTPVHLYAHVSLVELFFPKTHAETVGVYKSVFQSIQTVSLTEVN